MKRRSTYSCAFVRICDCCSARQDIFEAEVQKRRQYSVQPCRRQKQMYLELFDTELPLQAKIDTGSMRLDIPDIALVGD